jgi:hypothetical protein
MFNSAMADARQKEGPVGSSLYGGQLKDMLTKPGSFQGTPGYQWAQSQGMNAVGRAGAAKGQLGSGNVLTELNKFGTGLAQQDYGNQMTRLTNLLGQSQQNDLGKSELALKGELGRGQQSLDRELGLGALGQKRYDTDMGFTQGMFNTMSQYDLGSQRNQQQMLADLLGYDVNQMNAQTNRDRNDQSFLSSLLV